MTRRLIEVFDKDLEELNNLSFVAALAIYQHKKDTAIGLSHFTTKQRGLIWYYNVLLSQQLKNAAFYGAMQAIQNRMAQIIQEAQSSSLERQRELLLEALSLQESMEAWQRQISNM